MSAVFGWLSLLWIKATVILGLALVADLVLRGASARVRHNMWTGVFAALLLLPVLAAVLPTLPLPGIPAQLSTTPPTERAPETAGAVPMDALVYDDLVTDRTALGGSALPGTSEPDFPAAKLEPASTGQSFTLDREVVSRTVVVAWLLGFSAALALLVVSYRRAARLISRAGDLLDPDWRTDLRNARALIGLRGIVRLRATSRIGSPMAGGLRSAVVLVPHLARRWSAQRRRFVLLHELIHLLHRDPTRHLVARLALAIYWPTPLSWLAAHRAMAAREQACDEAVLALGARPSRYARELLELHATLSPQNTAAVAALPMIQKSLMEKRVMNILRTNRRRIGWPVGAALVAAGSLVTLSVAAAGPQDPDQDKPKVKVRVEQIKVDPKVVVDTVVKIDPKVNVQTVTATDIKVNSDIKVDQRLKVDTQIKVEPRIDVRTNIQTKVQPTVSAVEIRPDIQDLAPTVEVAPAPEVIATPIAIQEAAPVVATQQQPGRVSNREALRDIAGRIPDADEIARICRRRGDSLTIHSGFLFTAADQGDQVVCAGGMGVGFDAEGQLLHTHPDGVMIWQTYNGDRSRRLEIRADEQLTWYVDGAEQPIDATADQWINATRQFWATQWRLSDLRQGRYAMRQQQEELAQQRARALEQMAAEPNNALGMENQAAALRAAMELQAEQIEAMLASIAETEDNEKLEEALRRYREAASTIHEELEAYEIEFGELAEELVEEQRRYEEHLAQQREASVRLEAQLQYEQRARAWEEMNREQKRELEAAMWEALKTLLETTERIE